MSPQRLKKMFDAIEQFNNANPGIIPDEMTGTMRIRLNLGGVQDIELDTKLKRPEKSV